MAFAGKLFRSPPLLRFTAGGAASRLPEKISLSLSLGSLKSLMPNKVTNYGSSEISTNNESSHHVVSQETAQKNNQEIISTSDSRSCFKLFKFRMENNNNHDLALGLGIGMGFDQQKNKKAAAGDGLLGVFDQDSCKPLICHNVVKTETTNNGVIKKRKRANSELEEDYYTKPPPIKKRGILISSQDFNDLNMKKTLTKSDVDHSSRLLLGNKGVVDQILPNMKLNDEECIKKIAKEGGKKIKVYDLELKKERNLMLKQWKTNSFILNSGWTENFVKARKLREGDKIKLTWDQTSTRLNFSVVYRVFM